MSMHKDVFTTFLWEDETEAVGLPPESHYAKEHGNMLMNVMLMGQ